MSSKLKWLIVIQLLLTEETLCRVPPPLAPRDMLPPGNYLQGDVGETAKQEHQPPRESQPQLGPVSVVAQRQDSLRAAKRVVSNLGAKLQRQVQNHLHIPGNIGCEELLSASTMDDPSSSVFPRELLGLSLVPVLVVAGCPREAQTLVLKLYDLLGVEDTEELLMRVESLMEQKMSGSASMAASASAPPERNRAGQHIEAVMFNIQQLAVGEGSPTPEGHCEDWGRVNGTTLVGTAVDGAPGVLEEAVRACEGLGAQCAGVTSSGPLTPDMYRAVLKSGSRILPSETGEDECWIRRCNAEEDVSFGRRTRRSSRRGCISRGEENVHNVVEWIPVVSTLYNLGTAVYYASVDCSETAKERALMSAVDIGTDALMVATGGTAGVAGYALGAGMKTGVKAGVRYLLNSMREEDDVLVNQFSREEGVFTVP